MLCGHGESNHNAYQLLFIQGIVIKYYVNFIGLLDTAAQNIKVTHHVLSFIYSNDCHLH